MSRFVLHFHDCPDGHPRPSHCDLMLESDGMLRTWALAELPRDWEALGADASGQAAARPKIAGTNTVPAERLADHRLAYLDYEGPVSGNRGSVVRLDRGTYQTRSESDDCWEVTLMGEFLRGQIVLRQGADGSEMEARNDER